jgi:H+/Cl- antiporter ClcA
MHVDPGTMKVLGMIAVFLAGVFAWVVALLMLLEATRQLLDVLRYVVELAQLS